MLSNPFHKPKRAKLIHFQDQDVNDIQDEKDKLDSFDSGNNQNIDNFNTYSLPSIEGNQDGWNLFNTNNNQNDNNSEQHLPPINDYYGETISNAKKLERTATLTIDRTEYQRLLDELNDNAENKHYVLFFGQPGSGKTWIIASILFYLKQYAEGTAYLDSSKSSSNDLDLYYKLQDYFAGVKTAKDIARTSDKEYSQFSMSFTPKNSHKPPIEIVFVDASGEHFDLIMRNKNEEHSGKLPDYLNVILESNVNTKIALVYDNSIEDKDGSPLQLNVLNEIFTQIQLIQRKEHKFFPKVLILSKADRIENEDSEFLAQSGWDATTYAKQKISQFSNGFFNESDQNVCILYKMGVISDGSSAKLAQFDKQCPERFFNWLYKNSTGDDVINKDSLLKRFKKWFVGA